MQVALIVGYLADTRERRALFVGVVLLGEVPCLLTYWVTRYWQLLLLRCLTGISIGGTPMPLHSPSFSNRPSVHCSIRPLKRRAERDCRWADGGRAGRVAENAQARRLWCFRSSAISSPWRTACTSPSSRACPWALASWWDRRWLGTLAPNTTGSSQNFCIVVSRLLCRVGTVTTASLVGRLSRGKIRRTS